ncbi:MAG TPA: hypothetical protein VNW52_05350 [Burkholderiaceae bacterium]|jgi:hypothetical protein|nr:hypothetical protein [Burkholderiaceae bacterium]
MNSIRFIESATLLSIGVFCVSAVVSAVLPSHNQLSDADSKMAVVELPAVTIVGKRMNAAEKLASLKAEQLSAAKSMVVEHGKQLVTPAG